jgi:hypothetical protein
MEPLHRSIVDIDLRVGNRRCRLVFTRDLGTYDAPLMHAPMRIKEADVVLLESTYGVLHGALRRPTGRVAGRRPDNGFLGDSRVVTRGVVVMGSAALARHYAVSGSFFDGVHVARTILCRCREAMHRSSRLLILVVAELLRMSSRKATRQAATHFLVSARKSIFLGPCNLAATRLLLHSNENFASTLKR